MSGFPADRCSDFGNSQRGRTIGHCVSRKRLGASSQRRPWCKYAAALSVYYLSLMSKIWSSLRDRSATCCLRGSAPERLFTARAAPVQWLSKYPTLGLLTRLEVACGGSRALLPSIRLLAWVTGDRKNDRRCQASEKGRPTLGASALPRGERRQGPQDRAYADRVRKIVPEHGLPE